MNDKPLYWLHGEIKTPPMSREMRLEAGVLLRRLQRGESLGLPHSRPMPSIGRRCHELRVNDQKTTWRIIYRMDEDAILIVEVFAKKTQKTSDDVVKVGKKRLKEYDRAAGGKMKAQKKKRIEAAGWRSGSVGELLELTPEETAFIELKLALADLVKQIRTKNQWTQSEVARRLKSSQSRVAKMEAGEASVSLDLLVRSCFTLGASQRQVARAIASRAA